jgi:TRAP-type C4-dicarboxylate transport system permease large subunit
MAFLDGASIMLIMVPLITLTLVTYKMDLLVFGILLVINIEIGMLTPPVGLNLYVINGVLKNYGLSGNINTCIRGCFPFVLLYALAMLLVAVFPDIATFLPLSLRLSCQK